MIADRSGTEHAEIDARGMKCPWPALRLARAMRRYENVVIVADDPTARTEIAALATEHGWTVEDRQTGIGAGWIVSRATR